MEISKEETAQPPVPVLCHPHSTEVLRFVLSASCPGTGHLWTEPGSILSAFSFQLFVDTDEIHL